MRRDLVASVVLGVAAALFVSRTLRLESAPRLESRAARPIGSARPLSAPLPIRLVDLGGVGIPADTGAWGRDYSHNTRAFHQVLLASAPYVDPDQFERVRGEWSVYLKRMAAYGST